MYCILYFSVLLTLDFTAVEKQTVTLLIFDYIDYNTLSNLEGAVTFSRDIEGHIITSPSQLAGIILNRKSKRTLPSFCSCFSNPSSLWSSCFVTC